MYAPRAINDGRRGGLRHAARQALAALLVVAAGLAAPPLHALELPEYRVKAAFLLNFAAFVEWPPDVGPTLNLCVFGSDPFGAEIDALQGRTAGPRSLAVHRRATVEAVRSCQIVFVPAAAATQLPRLSDVLREQPVLIVAESPGALRQGATINLNLSGDRVTFEASLAAARSARLNLGVRLLRLATDVLS